ncbi:MAG: HEAT repeat domain-containing protein, partial [Planctomycetota bacterium]
MRRPQNASILSSLPVIVLLSGCAGGVVAGVDGQSGESVLDMLSAPSPEVMVQLAADETNPDNRQRGILMLANAPFGGDAVYMRFYEASIDDEDARVRAASARAMGYHGLPSHAETLSLRLRQDASEHVRLESARALQRLHNPGVIETLVGASRPDIERDADVREACVVALGQYRDTRVVQSLIGALQDRELRVNVAASESLALLTGQELGTDPRVWIDWTNSNSSWFAGARRYTYPVFHRTPLGWE